MQLNNQQQGVENINCLIRELRIELKDSWEREREAEYEDEDAEINAMENHMHDMTNEFRGIDWLVDVCRITLEPQYALTYLNFINEQYNEIMGENISIECRNSESGNIFNMRSITIQMIYWIGRIVLNEMMDEVGNREEPDDIEDEYTQIIELAHTAPAA
tara:strand:+ start:3485 stop:3964 length:480 start_codon:yes stop_codon:yes gene_type:complete